MLVFRRDGADEVVSAKDVLVRGERAAEFFVAGSYFKDDGLALFGADVESLLGGRAGSGGWRRWGDRNRERLVELLVPIDIWFGRGRWLFLLLTLRFGEVKAFEIEVKATFLQFEMLPPTVLVGLLFLEFIEIVERTAIRAGGGGAVAVKKLHFVEVAVDPIDGVGFLDVEVGFVSVAGALAAEEYPLIVDSARDDAGGLFAARCMFGESVFEEFEEVIGVFVVEK